MGRGTGRIEFEGFRVNGYCEYDGEFVRQPRKDIQPRPAKTFRGRTYAAAVSTESAKIMAADRAEELPRSSIDDPQWEVPHARIYRPRS